MIKVTVEVDGTQTQVHTGPGDAAPGSAAAPPDAGDVPTSVLAKAAATGAISAGPAPTHAGPHAATPIASSIQGPTPAAPAHAGISAGAAPAQPPGS